MARHTSRIACDTHNGRRYQGTLTPSPRPQPRKDSGLGRPSTPINTQPSQSASSLFWHDFRVRLTEANNNFSAASAPGLPRHTTRMAQERRRQGYGLRSSISASRPALSKEVQNKPKIVHGAEVVGEIRTWTVNDPEYGDSEEIEAYFVGLRSGYVQLFNQKLIYEIPTEWMSECDTRWIDRQLEY